MAMNMKEFLATYFQQLRFKDMPIEVRARFDDFVKKDDLTKNMQEWVKNYLNTSVNPPADKPLPDPTDNNVISKDDAEKIFNEFRNVLRAMDADKDAFKDNKDAKAFFDEYFGPGRMFSQTKASTSAEVQMKELAAVLDANPKLRILMERDNVIDKSDFTFDALKKGLNTDAKKYNTDEKLQSRIKDISEYLAYMIDTNPEFSKIFKNKNIDFTAIQQGFDSSKIPLGHLDMFRRELPSMLRRIHSKDKLRDAFTQFGGGKITSHFDDAKKKIAYDDKESKDFIQPKSTDELTPWQQLKRDLGDTYEDYLARYKKLKPDHKYYQPQAELIMRAIDGQKITPKDGLGKILDNAGKIKDSLRLKSPTALEHFEWMTKTLADIKARMPKAFEGAQKNGRQMRALVSEIVLKAVKDGKKDAAKTTMEILAIHRYGITTSRVMDILRGKEGDVSIFSDGKLSWNKNEGMQFITRAMDKSIKYAFLGIGYTLTAAGNLYRRSGRKFNGKSKRIDPLRNKMNAELDVRKDELRRLNDQDRDQIPEINKVPTHDGTVTKSDVEASRDALKADIKTLNNKKSATEKAKNKFSNLANTLGQKLSTINQTKSNLESQITDIQNKKREAKAAVKTLSKDITQMRNDLSAATTDEDKQILIQRIALAESKLAEEQDKLTQLKDPAATKKMATDWRNAHNVADTLQAKLDKTNRLLAPKEAEIKDYEKQLQRKHGRLRSREKHLEQFQEAADSIQTLNDQIAQREAELNNMSPNANEAFNELMGFWDFVTTGHNTYIGSKKKAQNRFDKNKQALFAQYRTTHGY